jgi:hypothetical protein
LFSVRTLFSAGRLPFLLAARCAAERASSFALAYIYGPFLAVSSLSSCAPCVDQAEDDQFGYAVTLDGDTIVVGTSGAGAYVFSTSNGGRT